MFKNAIVLTPCPEMVNGITTADLGKPDYALALKQHTQYITALEACGLKVEVLPANHSFPDSTFIEDVAVCTARGAVITRPGALSRRGEIAGIPTILKHYFEQIGELSAPGTLEGGDVMMVEDHFFIGISDRTNEAGADQLIQNLRQFGMTGSKVPLKHFLHLKTGVAYLENNNLLVSGEFVDNPAFGKFNKIVVPEAEMPAANSIWINGRVLIPKNFPITKGLVEKAGYPTIEMDISEFQKLDGGLSCLSLRF